MTQIGLHIQADPVKADPFADLDPDSGDLVLAAPARAPALDPDPDPAVTDPGLDPEGGQGPHQPLFQPPHEGAHVAAALVQVQHHIGHPLSGPVIGELPAPTGPVHREPARIQQIGVPARYPCRIEGRMLQQPDQLRSVPCRDRGRPGLHRLHGGGIVDRRGRDRPAHGPAVGTNQARRLGI